MIRSIKNSSRHWLFWPSVSLLGIFLGYLVLLGENGYLNYLVASQEKVQLEKKILEYEKQKEDLKNRLKLLSDKDKALETFTREFLLFPEKVAILKFEDSERETEIQQKQIKDFTWIQRIYVVFGNIALLSIAYFFWRREKNKEHDYNEEIH